MPNVYFGPVQTLGLVLGVATSLAGVLLYWPLGESDDEAMPLLQQG